MTKDQKQLAMLGGLVAAIVIVLVVFVLKPGGPAAPEEGAFAPRAVETRVPDGVLKHPEYRKLSSPVELPLKPGQTGRDNPFEPY